MAIKVRKWFVLVDPVTDEVVFWTAGNPRGPEAPALFSTPIEAREFEKTIRKHTPTYAGGLVVRQAQLNWVFLQWNIEGTQKRWHQKGLN